MSNEVCDRCGGSYSFGCYECSPVSNKPDTSAGAEVARLQRLLKAERYDYARAIDERDKARAEIFTAYVAGTNSGYAAGLEAAARLVEKCAWGDYWDFDGELVDPTKLSDYIRDLESELNDT